MSVSDKNSTAAWCEAMIAKGHTPVERDEDMGGGIDMFAVSYEFHNGPRCATCGWRTCVHCDSVDNIPECDAVKSDLRRAQRRSRCHSTN